MIILGGSCSSPKAPISKPFMLKHVNLVLLSFKIFKNLKEKKLRERLTNNFNKKSNQLDMNSIKKG